ncbi:SDR family oxidoreductase [Nitratireductor sp. XY-223]|uniref:SDR family oxidoreductase n=1 Tax=Nitratireductor sp. XY-223 TaxID=2561926 RepID=UPI0010AAB91C|nr:SDR family oxidoreductase [Nitratireductor sp. XY-223]
MRVALTGGATGIGASVAAKLKARGAHVTAFDLNEPQHNVDRWIKTDLGDAGSISAAAEAAEGPFDALINNAGLPPREGLEALILKVNFVGLRLFLDAMLDKLAPNAAIVNTASRAGFMWRDNIEQVKALMALGTMDDVPGFVAAQEIDAVRAYNLSKEAVIALTIARTEDMIARNLRMNSVSPAAVSTGILDDFLNAFGERAQKAVARAGRAGEPDEIADVICFLASPESRWIKGQDILIDGGISAMTASDMLGLRP